MQLIRCAAVGVLFALYLSTDSWCHYIPDKKTSATNGRTHSSRPGQIRICGNALTSFIIKACGGIVVSFTQVSSASDSAQTKITEDCCDKGCTMDYIQNYCGHTPLFNTKSTSSRKAVSKKLLTSFSNSPSADSGPSTRSIEKGRRKGAVEVRVRNKNDPERNLGMSRKKRKRSFKRKCAYKSFGHYLLNLDRGDRVRSNSAKDRDNYNRTWPSIQIGTVSPEMDKFGGQPIVVLKKNRSNSV